MAEGVGFEPTVPLTARSISSQRNGRFRTFQHGSSNTHDINYLLIVEKKLDHFETVQKGARFLRSI